MIDFRAIPRMAHIPPACVRASRVSVVGMHVWVTRVSHLAGVQFPHLAFRRI